ncbi:MAG: hypothetical protein A3K65_04050 [Euryarchaeota archaeon RBG_16_68_12]|nr:MAG: hypothetical protein A3K65_04050 [Euryarchaeota archaeon RBG_16_68_12]
MFVVAVVAILIAYLGFFVDSLLKDLSSDAIFGLLVALVAAGLLLVRSTRRAIIFEGGLTVPELRLSESLGPALVVPFDRIAPVDVLVEPTGDTGWVLATDGRRRITIWEGYFADPEAVHRLLSSLFGDRMVVARGRNPWTEGST